MVSELVRIETECSARTSNFGAPSSLSLRSLLRFPPTAKSQTGETQPYGPGGHPSPRWLSSISNSDSLYPSRLNTRLVNHISDFSSPLTDTYSPFSKEPPVPAGCQRRTWPFQPASSLWGRVGNGREPQLVTLTASSHPVDIQLVA